MQQHLVETRQESSWSRYAGRPGGHAVPLASHLTSRCASPCSALVALRFDKVDSEGHTTELKLEPYEIAALMNLFPRDVDVATKLIPSLAKLEDDQVRVVLDELELVKSEHSFE